MGIIWRKLGLSQNNMAQFVELSSGPSNNVIVSAACIGAAVCAGVYVIWGPDHLFRKRGRCSGLVNLGNTCFINAILQSLAALPRVREWLEKVASLNLHNGPLGLALNNIVRDLNDDDSNICSPREILRALTMHYWRIDFQQQDSHELYQILLNTLEQEMSSSSSLADILEIKDASPHSKAWTRAGSVSTPSRPLSCPLRGMLTSELHCMKCNHSLPLKYEFFDSISLTLPQYKCTLENCLLEFIKSEMVNDVHCPRCSKMAGVSVKETHIKKLQIGRAPTCICIHFNRTLWNPEGYLYKNDLHIAFPIELDASTLLKREGGRGGVRYLLCAVVEHRGGPNSGHYITYRRCGTKGKQWVCTSDTRVYSITVGEVLESTAYMLFYCRKNSTASNS